MRESESFSFRESNYRDLDNPTIQRYPSRSSRDVGKRARMKSNRGIFEDVTPADTVIHLVNSRVTTNYVTISRNWWDCIELGIISR